MSNCYKLSTSDIRRVLAVVLPQEGQYYSAAYDIFPNIKEGQKFQVVSIDPVHSSSEGEVKITIQFRNSKLSLLLDRNDTWDHIPFNNIEEQLVVDANSQIKDAVGFDDAIELLTKNHYKIVYLNYDPGISLINWLRDNIEKLPDRIVPIVVDASQREELRNNINQLYI